MRDPFYCKECERSGWIDVRPTYSGDALVECTCGRTHGRQFVAGEAVSCEPPRTRRVLRLEVAPY